MPLLYSREPFIILSGGLSYDTVGRRPCLTVMHGKSTAVLEMDYSIVDFLTLCETPYPNGRLWKDFSQYFDLSSLEFYPIRIFFTIAFLFYLWGSDCSSNICYPYCLKYFLFPKHHNTIVYYKTYFASRRMPITGSMVFPFFNPKSTCRQKVA